MAIRSSFLLPLSLLAIAIATASCRAPTNSQAAPAVSAPAASESAAADDESPARADTPEASEPTYDGPPKTVLVELFTSQGCNSCPPADAFIGELASLDWSADRVIPLTYHVTYWDDLGWQDPYARQLFDQRQIGYAQQVTGRRAPEETTLRGPYTPQLVVDGQVHFSGTLRDVAREEVTRLSKRPTLIELSIERATAAPPPAGAEPVATVEVRSSMREGAALDTDAAKIGLFAALVHEQLSTEVPRGENAGKTLREFNVVRAFQGPKLFRSHRAENKTRFELPLPEGVAPVELQVVVFAQGLGDLGVYTVDTSPLS